MKDLKCDTLNIFNITNDTRAFSSVTFYLGKNDYITKDTMAQTLEKATQKSCFKDYVTENVIGIPTIYRIWNSSIITNAIPQLQNDT